MPGMEKVLRGILSYRNTVRKQMVEQFKQVKDNPNPTAVFFTCMDSRLLPSSFCQTNVGDMFFVRNAGNLIPHAKLFGWHSATTEPGALVLGCEIGNIRHVVVCGHSDCKAMNLLYSTRDSICHHHGNELEVYVRKHGAATVTKFEQLEAMGGIGPITFQGETIKRHFEAYIDPENKLKKEDKFSQVNVLVQLQNIASYPFLHDKLHSGKVRLHAMWFDIYTGNVFLFSRQRKQFVEVNEETFEHLLEDSESYVAKSQEGRAGIDIYEHEEVSESEIDDSMQHNPAKH